MVKLGKKPCQQKKNSSEECYGEPVNYNLGFTVSVRRNNRIVIPANIINVAHISEGDIVNVTLVSVHKKSSSFSRAL